MSLGALPLTLQKAKFSAWQNLVRAQFRLCVDSPACCLPQLEHNFQAPGQSQAPAASHLEKLWDAESNCMVLPWTSIQLPFRSAKAQFSYVLITSYQKLKVSNVTNVSKKKKKRDKKVNRKSKQAYLHVLPPWLCIISDSKIGQRGQGNLRTQDKVGAATPQPLWSPPLK